MVHVWQPLHEITSGHEDALRVYFSDSGTDSARGRGPWAMGRGNVTDQRVLGQGNSRQVWVLIFYTMILSSTYLTEKV